MSDGPSVWSHILSAIIASPAAVAAVWGALGGSTNVLVIRVTLCAANRHIAIGTLVAAGVGGADGPLLEWWGVAAGPGCAVRRGSGD